LYIFIVVDGL